MCDANAVQPSPYIVGVPRHHAVARAHLTRRDPVLAPVIARIGTCHLSKQAETDFFVGLVRSIISQQLSAKAAATIEKRVAALIPDGGGLTPLGLLGVPKPALRTAGLSTRKAEYVHDLSERISTGRLDLQRLRECPDEEVFEVLTSVRGIGRWSAEMFLIFRLQRPDILPLDDVGLQRAVQKVYGLKRRPTPKQFTRLAEPWRPYRSVACWYLWASLDV